ncbi:MAG: putative DNA binding domain-containing protein [Sterolibacteriaceae bacterium]|nr:putative DNA binding domain-containing protein [Sterolibacteriaceae bacterium]MBK9086002.1 putative DNA binding domain-containing protein [Sterolibacteriaceae bacterium]
MDIHDLLRASEGKTLEFKRNLDSPQSVLRVLVAFANTAGGTLLIGVEDRTRAVCGVAEPLALEERLASLIADSIEPRLVPDIEILPWRTTQVIAVAVFPSQNRPHHLRREGPENGTYVRVGSTNRRADAALIAEMRRHALGEGFDEQPMPALDSEAIDFRAASESFAPVRTLKPGDLATLRLTTRHQGRTVPTVGGVLLFGADRLAHFPDAWIQVGRFAGADKTKILDHAELSLHPVAAVETAIAFIQRHMQRAAEIGALRRRDRWTLPPVAVREALINAVVHADYSQRGAPIRVALYDDRLEIENPGLLPFGLIVDDLRHGISRLRNRVIGRVFHELGLIEQWGSGIQRMSSACAEAGLAVPDLEEIGLRFRVTLRTTQVGPPRIDALDQAILDVLADAAGHATAEIARHIGRTPRATRTRLIALIERNLIREIGTGPRDPQRRYYLVKSS